MQELPAIMLVGPRATGKTTTAMRHAETLIRLDRPAEAAAFRADPDVALRDLPEPVALDEWQEVPELLGAVKRAVDVDPRPGRFLLTGSVRADLVAQTWPGTGRVTRLPLLGMTVGEQIGTPTSGGLIDQLIAGDVPTVPSDPPDLRGYLELALKSGFPEPALGLSPDTGRAWLRGYVDQLVTRDAELIETVRDPSRLRRYLEAYATTSAGIVDEKTLADAAGLNRKTASAYERLLANLFIVDGLPAWSSNRLKRLRRSQKRYVIDAGLLAGILQLDVASVLRDGDVMGRVIDTFVVSHLRTEVETSAVHPRLFHLRTEQGRHEVDVIAEFAGGRVVAIEIKASATPTVGDARHIAWLKDQLGERFVGGAVLHTGHRAFPLGDRIVAAPICSLWG